MPISATDITIQLSGGSSNTNPSLSFGDATSLYPVGTTINSLFSDITSEQATNGYVDYRCVYVVNNSASFSFYDVTVSLTSQVDSGATVNFGVLSRNEVQKITFTTLPTGGSIIISHEGNLSDSISWDSNPAIFAQNLEDGLNSISSLSGVVCSQGSTDYFFAIEFAGDSGNRNQNLLVLNTNALTPVVPSPTFSVVTEGSPRNDIASSTGSVNTVPFGVDFTTEDVTIGELLPEEGFPLWFRRTVSSGTQPLAGDGVSLQITGNVFN